MKYFVIWPGGINEFDTLEGAKLRIVELTDNNVILHVVLGYKVQ